MGAGQNSKNMRVVREQKHLNNLVECMANPLARFVDAGIVGSFCLLKRCSKIFFSNNTEESGRLCVCQDAVWENQEVKSNNAQLCCIFTDKELLAGKSTYIQESWFYRLRGCV